MSLDEKQAADLDALVQRLEQDRDHLKVLSSLLEMNAEAAYQDMASMNERIETIRRAIDSVQADLRKQYAAEYDEIERTAKSIERQKEAIKNYCHLLPKESLVNPFAYTHGNVSITVSRAEFSSSYNTESLLRAHPELEEIYVDGDPLVGRSIVPEVLDRLIESGEVSLPDIDTYRNTFKKRNPSVSIRLKDENS